MRTSTLRRLAAPTLVAVMVLVGCGGDGDDDSSNSTSTTEAAGDDAATTTSEAAEDESTTTAAEDEATTTAEDEGSAATTAPEGSGPDQEATGAPDEEVPEVTWALDAVDHRGKDGARIAYLCPPDGEISTVWGTGTYTDDSSVCSAGVHAGIINPVEGGRVVIEIAPGEDAYEGSEANDVTSLDYGSWSGSFTFPVG